MNLDDFQTLITGETVCRLQELYTAKWISENTIMLVDYATQTYHIYLRFDNPETADWIRQLYRSTDTCQPRARPGCTCISHDYKVVVHDVPTSAQALHTIEMWSDKHAPDAVIIDWYERSRDGKHIDWRIHLAQVYNMINHKLAEGILAASKSARDLHKAEDHA